MERNLPKSRTGLAFFKWVRLVFTAGIEILYAYFAWMIRYSAHPERYPLEERYGKVHKLAFSLTKKLHVELSGNAIETFSSLKGSNLIVSNHLSIFDIVALLAISEKPITFIGKKETSTMPFVGKCLKSIHGFFLDREDPKQAVHLFMEIGKYMRENQATVVVYPEGTRLRDHYADVGEFHAGTFKLVEWGEANLMPLAGFGTWRPLSKSEHESSFPVELKFLPPLSYEECKGVPTTSLADNTHDAINEEVHAMQDFDIEYYAQKRNRQRARKWWKK